MIRHADGGNGSESFEFLVMSSGLRCSLRSRIMGSPLSLALSREVRGKVIFESIECILSVVESSRWIAPVRDSHVPSPLAEEGQGEGDMDS